MKLLTEEIKARLPKLYTTDGKSPSERKIVVKFFDPTGNWTWYVIEGEQMEDGDWLFFGLVDGFEKEYGYFRLSELETAKDNVKGLRSIPIERDINYGFEHTLAEVQ